MKTRDMILCAVFAAVICIFSVITVPIGAVPVSMSVFGILLTASILGAKHGAASVLIYIFLGSVGLPVFSGFKGGISVLLGPTGGYISAYVFVAMFVGYFADKLSGRRRYAVAMLAIISFVGVLICYLLGTLQFMVVADKDFLQAASVCVLPFIPFDIAKCIGCAVLAHAVRTALVRAKFLKTGCQSGKKADINTKQSDNHLFKINL